MVERLRTWLCPTPEHRVRVVEAGPRVRTARRVAAGAIGVGTLLAAPWTGWWTLALFVPAGVLLLTLDRFLDRSDSPELIALGTLLAMMALIAAAAAGTGGSDSPVLVWLAIPPGMAALRFRWTVTMTLCAVAALTLLAVGLGVDAAAVADDPVTMIAALVMLANVVAVTSALMRGELEHRQRAVVDPLTGLLNRGAIKSRAPELEQQARVTGASVCLVLCDLDRFKQVNDTYGHERGDAVLKEAAYAIRKTLRSFELVYRIGGEELLVVLPDVELAEGVAIGERLRIAVEDARPGGLDLTLSAGVAAAAGHAVSYDDLFREADGALLCAKRAGRNRVEVAGLREPVPAEAASA
ncbi:MAG: GGDEF domain-containing protein [Thermoleophilaceae bacterium]